MNQPEEDKVSGCGSKAGKWIGILVCGAVGAVVGFFTNNLVPLLTAGLVVGFLFSFGIQGGG